MATGIENHHLGPQVVDVHLNRKKLFFWGGGVEATWDGGTPPISRGVPSSLTIHSSGLLI